MNIQFQLLIKGNNKPDTISISDAYQEIPNACQAPMIGDCVALKYTHPADRRGNFGHFKIVARHFSYDTKNTQQHDIIAIVEEVDSSPENNFRE